MAYATVAEYKARVSVATTDDDGVIAEVLDAASAYIDQRTGRRFTLDAVASPRYYEGTGEDLLWVDDIGSEEDLAVVVDDAGDWSYGLALTLTTDYVLEPDVAPSLGRPWTALRLRPGGQLRAWPARPRAVRVTARWGWPAAPPPVREATVHIARQIRDLHISGILLQLTQIDAAVQRSDETARLVRDVLTQYGRTRWL